VCGTIIVLTMTTAPNRRRRGFSFSGLRTRLTILFQDERSNKPDRLRNKAASCNGFRLTSDNGYLEIEYDRAVAIGFQVKDRARRGVMSLYSCAPASR
jgi:hypothetical protein